MWLRADASVSRIARDVWENSTVDSRARRLLHPGDDVRRSRRATADARAKRIIRRRRRRRRRRVRDNVNATITVARADASSRLVDTWLGHSRHVAPTSIRLTEPDARDVIRFITMRATRSSILCNATVRARGHFSRSSSPPRISRLYDIAVDL